MAMCLLRCGHTVHYDPVPEPGDTVYCRQCSRYSRVKVASQEWWWKCPACHTSRRFGADEETARGSARRHQRKYHHVLVLRHGYDTVAVIGPEGQQELSIAGERISWVANHQGSLKAAVEKAIVQRGQSTKDIPPF